MTARDRHAGDVGARRLAQTEFDRPVAVVAGAGTGKTTVRVARVLAWCLGRGWTAAFDRLTESGSQEPSPDEIAGQALDGLVAITFTEAAAAQMARKVAQALVTIAADPSLEVVGFFPDLIPDADSSQMQQRARALVGALDRLAIRTLHSHCWNLLATYPMAARLSLDLRVDAEGRHLEEVVREVVEAAVKGAYAGPASHPLHRLAMRMVDPRAVAEAVRALVAEGFNAEAFDRDPLSAKNRGVIRQRLETAVTAVREFVAPLTTQNRARKDLQVAEAVSQTETLLSEVPKDLDLPALTALLEGLREIWEDDLVDRLVKWSKGDFTRTVENLLGERSAKLGRTAGNLAGLLRLYRQLDVEVLDAGRRALRPLIAAVEDELRARGVLTYSSLMTEAWRLLAEHPQVRRRERRRLHQLLVDEFQDTDRLQCELVRFLTLDGDESERPGLFVVGDPKQSIYGWRDADLEAYESFLHDLESAGGVTVELNRNFRSVPAVLEEVDHAIRPIMTAEPGLQPEFASLLPCAALLADSGFQRAGRAPIEYWVSWTETGGPKTRADDAAGVEAQAIASDIRQLHDQEQVAWNEFGILLRSTSRLETYLEALRRFGVPFVVTSDKHYFRRREIIEASALIRTVLVPVDHLALVTFLRSPTVGVPDAALLPLWQRGFPELVTKLQGSDGPELETLRAVVKEVAENLSGDIPGLDAIRGWDISTVAALENLALLRPAFTKEPADKFLDQLRQRFLFDVTESARHLGIYRLANLDRFFQHLESALEEQSGDIQGVLRTLRRSVAESEEAEQALPEGAAEEAVQVMTIHGAKGLEFGHVYLPQLHARGRQSQRPTVKADRRWIPGQGAEYVLFGSPTPGFDQVDRRESQIERTEQVRTLYVAMTRAKRRLVLLGNWPEAPAPIDAEERVTYLDLLRSREALPESVSELFDPLVGDEATCIDLGAARWRFPALERRSFEPRDATITVKATLPSAEEIQQESALLDELRARAVAHMERAFSGTASAEAATRLKRVDGDEDTSADQPSPRDIALTVGDVFHRMLESWDLGAEPSAELQRQRDIQEKWLVESLPKEQVQPARDRFASLLDRFHRGQFFRRFSELAEHVVAREVPVVLPPEESDTGPVGYLTGFIDLLYRDPGTGDWVIVDYKTDRLQEESEIEERAAAYARQEAVYARAIQESLDLDQPPATQLWFIWPDRLQEGPAAS